MAAGLILNYTNLALRPPGASFSLSSHNEITLLISYLLYLNFKYADILYNKRFIACIHYLTGKEGRCEDLRKAQMQLCRLEGET